MAQIKRRGSNIYQIAVFLGRDQRGKRIIRYETFYGTKTQAQRRAAELEVDLRRRSGPRTSAMTVGVYLEKWLNRIRNSVSENAYEGYRWHVRRLLPFIGHLPLYGLCAVDLQDGLAELTGAAATVKNIYGTLRTAMRQAVAWGILAVDPTVGLRTPRVPKAERRVLSAGELVRLLDAARSFKHYPVIRVLAIGGMRLGEALGLIWQDVDFSAGKVSVRRSVNTRKRRSKPDTKTPGSRRTIPLDQETLKILKTLKAGQERARVKPIKMRDVLVFHADNDPMLPVRDDAVRRTLKRALKKAGLPHIRVHDLRHTAGSLLVAAGVPMPVVADFLGHSSPATTAAVYAHAVSRKVNVTDALPDQSGKCQPGVKKTR